MLSNELIFVSRKVYESPDVAKFIRQLSPAVRFLPLCLPFFYHPQQDHVVKALEP